ncbi:DUF1684 domain-containing protein [Streptomyces sp. NPDC055078]
MSTDAQQSGQDGPGGPGARDGSADRAAHAARKWRKWHERRVEAISSPYGPLSLTGTHWLDDHPEGRIPAIPGVWEPAGGEIVLTARAEDALTVDGKPFTGAVRLTADHGPIPGSRVAHGGRRLVVLRREGLWAVRDFDPDAPARASFTGIDATPYDPRWRLPGRFRAYSAHRSVRVANADGRERGLGLGGEIAFVIDGVEHTLGVAVEDDGSLWAVFADATSGDSSYRFRFLRPREPRADGTVTVDLNRALLPPCAFADHFICPLPPPGNTLPVAVPAGERKPLTR